MPDLERPFAIEHRSTAESGLQALMEAKAPAGSPTW